MPNKKQSKSNVRRVVSTALRREHGFVRRRTRFDPPNYKNTIVVQFKRRALLPASTTAYRSIDIPSLLPPTAIAYKISLVQAWNGAADATDLTLQYRKQIAGGSSEYQNADTMVVADRAGKNHFPCCSLVPPQDDWFNLDQAETAIVDAKGTGEITVDVSFMVRYGVPEVTVPANFVTRVLEPEELPDYFAHMSLSAKTDAKPPSDTRECFYS